MTGLPCWCWDVALSVPPFVHYSYLSNKVSHLDARFTLLVLWCRWALSVCQSVYCPYLSHKVSQPNDRFALLMLWCRQALSVPQFVHSSYLSHKVGQPDDRFTLLMLWCRWTLSVPVPQFIHTVHVQHRLQPSTVVIYQSEVLVLHSTAHLMESLNIQCTKKWVKLIWAIDETNRRRKEMLITNKRPKAPQSWTWVPHIGIEHILVTIGPKTQTLWRMLSTCFMSSFV